MIIPLYFRSYRWLSRELSETNKSITDCRKLIKNTIKNTDSDMLQKVYALVLKDLKKRKAKLIKEINRRADRVAISFEFQITVM